MWSVIIEYDNSKILNKQSNNSLKNTDFIQFYHLILVLAQEKRKLDLTMNDIKVIFFGKDEEYTNLYNKHSSKNISENKSEKVIQTSFEGF